MIRPTIEQIEAFALAQHELSFSERGDRFATPDEMQMHRNDPLADGWGMFRDAIRLHFKADLCGRSVVRLSTVDRVRATRDLESLNDHCIGPYMAKVRSAAYGHLLGNVRRAKSETVELQAATLAVDWDMPRRQHFRNGQSVRLHFEALGSVKVDGKSYRVAVYEDGLQYDTAAWPLDGHGHRARGLEFMPGVHAAAMRSYRAMRRRQQDAKRAERIAEERAAEVKAEAETLPAAPVEALAVPELIEHVSGAGLAVFTFDEGDTEPQPANEAARAMVNPAPADEDSLDNYHAALAALEEDEEPTDTRPAEPYDTRKGRNFAPLWFSVLRGEMTLGQVSAEVGFWDEAMCSRRFGLYVQRLAQRGKLAAFLADPKRAGPAPVVYAPGARRIVGAALLRDAFRESVLAALDETAGRLFSGSPQLGRDPGATDQDLPPLFAALDAHALRLADRFGFEVTEEDA
jgi:hypothetical protein